MASDDSNKSPQPEESGAPKREALSGAKRKRLQQTFEHGSKQMAQENYDYANVLFSQCVAGDPSNLTYVRIFWENLQKKYGNNKKGSNLAQFKERGARSGVKKCLSASEWDEVVTHGLKVLAVNPWDVPTLTAMATAADKMGDDEPELFYLRCALEANPKDVDVNILCSKALAERQQFDQAIACLHRAEKIRPDDEEIQRMIATLAVEKTIVHGKLEDDETAAKYAGDRKKGTAAKQEEEVSPEELLKREIRAKPKEIPNYYKLADLHLARDKFDAAEDLLRQAVEVSDNDPDVCERLQDAEIRNLRYKISVAQGEDAKAKLREQYYAKEQEVYEERVERYPNNLAFKYELGLRYQLNKNYNDAIKQFQMARNDPRRKGLCMLHLGRCFVRIKQYRLAMSHFESAIGDIPDRDADNKKDALHRAGKLALALRNLDAADKHLSVLAGLDFTYKDVSELLDKIAQLRDQEEEEGDA